MEQLFIKKLKLKNRIIIPPMVCFYMAGEDGYVTDKHIAHYEELARGGASLVIVEATAVSPKGKLHKTEIGLWEDGQIEGFRKITDAIHTHGAYAFVQLNHAGGISVGDNLLAPSDGIYHGRKAYEMKMTDIEELIFDFANAALRAKKAGFDGVELHGCHGYLLSCFMSNKRNKRMDIYGQNKTLIVKQIFDAVRELCGKDFIVGIRIGAFEPLLVNGLKNAEELQEYADFMDVSYGTDAEYILPEGYPCSGAVYGAEQIKKMLPNMPVFGVDGVNSAEDVKKALETGIDGIDVGRASLVDPEFAKHVLNGEPAGKCMKCERCKWRPDEIEKGNHFCAGKELLKRHR